jgi:hypothetical protein
MLLQLGMNITTMSLLVVLLLTCFAEAGKRMTYKNVVSGIAMLVGFGQKGFSKEAVRVFVTCKRMGLN